MARSGSKPETGDGGQANGGQANEFQCLCSFDGTHLEGEHPTHCVALNFIRLSPIRLSLIFLSRLMHPFAPSYAQETGSSATTLCMLTFIARAEHTRPALLSRRQALIENRIA